MLRSGTFFDWCPTGPTCLFQVQSSEEQLDLTTGSLSTLAGQGAFDTYLRPFLKELLFIARSDGIFLFRLVLRLEVVAYMERRLNEYGETAKRSFFS